MDKNGGYLFGSSKKTQEELVIKRMIKKTYFKKPISFL
jgi:hypothetical protein